MTTRNEFRQDNTSGYSDVELEHMNSEYETAIKKYNLDVDNPRDAELAHHEACKIIKKH